MIQTSWKIESAWKVEPMVHPNEAGWTLVETWERDLYDDYEGEELHVVPPSPHHLSCRCGSTEFIHTYKRWNSELLDEDGEYLDSQDDGDSCDDGSDYYSCRECDAEVIWRP